MPESEEGCFETIQFSGDDTKNDVRAKVLDYLQKSNINTDPQMPKRRIANFKGSSEAAEMLSKMEVFENAKIVRIDPDKALQEIRLKALETGKTLLVPTPYLMNHVVSQIIPPEGCPPDLFKSCATRMGVEEYSKAIDIDEKISVDAYIVGSVAVSTKGSRVGKGGGLIDLEYAMLASLGVVDAKVPVITMVHDYQVVDFPDSLVGGHDVSVDFIVTPTRVIECSGKFPKPSGVLWNLVEAEKLSHIPVLKRVRYRQWKAGVDVKLSGETDDPVELTDVILDENATSRPKRGHQNSRRGFSRRGPNDNDGAQETRRTSERRGGPSDRGRFRSYRNSRFDDRYQGDQRQERMPYSYRRNNNSERPGNRAYDKRPQNPRRKEAYDTFEGSIYVGSLPRSLRVSQFKTEVRERKVNPLRVLWRGSSGFAFLNFKSQQDAEEALVALEGLQISDRAIKFEMAKSPSGQKRQAAPRNGMGENPAATAVV